MEVFTYKDGDRVYYKNGNLEGYGTVVGCAKQRAYFWHKYILKYEEDTITPDRIGRSAANHCTHDCKMCNHWKHDGRNERPFSERRKGIPDDHE
jgi:hypothetical protein